jgi:hypothetical protein
VGSAAEVASRGDQKQFKGIAVSERTVFTFTAERIYWRPRTAGNAGWYYLEKQPAVTNLDQLFACNDGSLLATVGNKIYLWDGETWRLNKKADAIRVFKEPVLGWELFAAVNDQIKELRAVTAGVAQAIPTEARAPA